MKPSSIKNQKGQSLVEYLILVAIIGVGSMALTRALGHQINVSFAEVVEKLGGRVEGPKETAKVSADHLKQRDMTDFMNGARSR
jgi:pilus assembly protein Flp/PilA